MAYGVNQKTFQFGFSGWKGCEFTIDAIKSGIEDQKLLIQEVVSIKAILRHLELNYS